MIMIEVLSMVLPYLLKRSSPEELFTRVLFIRLLSLATTEAMQKAADVTPWRLASRQGSKPELHLLTNQLHEITH